MQARLEVTDGFIAEVANQSADKTRHAFGQFGGKSVELGLQVMERILSFWDLEVLDGGCRAAFHALACDAVLIAWFQADKGVAGDALATFDRFEQEGGAAAAHFEIDAGRRIEVGRQAADDRGNAGAGLDQFSDHNLLVSKNVDIVYK